MAKLKTHGSILKEFTAPFAVKYRLMSDGYILKNYGKGWKVHLSIIGAVRGRPMSEGKEGAAVITFERLRVNLTPPTVSSMLAFA